MTRFSRARMMTATAILIASATLCGSGVARADDTASIEFENTLSQPITLEVTDNIPKRPIHLGPATENGKPSVSVHTVGFKTPKDKKGNINLRVDLRCGNNTDSFIYTKPPSTIKAVTGCRLTRS